MCVSILSSPGLPWAGSPTLEPQNQADDSHSLAITEQNLSWNHSLRHNPSPSDITGAHGPRTSTPESSALGFSALHPKSAAALQTRPRQQLGSAHKPCSAPRCTGFFQANTALVYALHHSVGVPTLPRFCSKENRNFESSGCCMTSHPRT